MDSRVSHPLLYPNTRFPTTEGVLNIRIIDNTINEFLNHLNETTHYDGYKGRQVIQNLL